VIKRNGGQAMKLPVEFIDKMKNIVPQQEWDKFIAAYDEPIWAGLRVNTLKIAVEALCRRISFDLEPVPWEPTGFYYDRKERPAKHPYYHAGLYYIQEPSAMTPAAVLAPKTGERVLDLCAAPGGKTTQLAAAMQGQGVIVANDLGSDRVKVLIKNIELMGIPNAIVTNETPERLARCFPEYFDRVLVDAPCSGEGMFRKDAGVLSAWTPQSNLLFARTQQQIIASAAEMLRPGGRLVYSTCTFSPAENEELILRFLEEHTDFTLIDIPKIAGMAPGIVTMGQSMPDVARLWPHRIKGEGHFVALLEKSMAGPVGQLAGTQQNKLSLDTFYDFTRRYLQDVDFTGTFVAYGEHLYLQPRDVPLLQGLKAVRPGLYLGQLKKNRFEPSHALALTLRAGQVKNRVDYPAAAPEVIRYLKAETVLDEGGEKGWVLFCVDGYPLGWAKRTAEGLKNYYPIAWRWVD
jgi:NOL1/NOP2/sun family putative RNA methylase